MIWSGARRARNATSPGGVHTHRVRRSATVGHHQRVTTRRDVLQGATIAGAAAAATAIAGGHVIAQQAPTAVPRPVAASPAAGGLLYPRQNAVRNLLDLSGLWDFQLDPKEEG